MSPPDLILRAPAAIGRRHRGGVPEPPLPVAPLTTAASAAGQRVASGPVYPYLLAVAALAVAAAAIAAILTGSEAANPAAFALAVAWSVVAFTFAAVLWRRARPWSAYGTLLAASGFLIAGESLYARSQSLPYSLGFVVDCVQVLLVWWLIVAFPSGRLDRAGRLVFGAAVIVVGAGIVPMLLMAPVLRPLPAAAHCVDGCPSNALQVIDAPSLASAWSDVYVVLRSTFAVVLVVVLVARYARASEPRRRMLLPVYSVSTLWMAAFFAYGIAQHVAPASDGLTYGIGLSLAGARALVPLGFAAAIVLARAHAGAALQTMVRSLVTRSSAASIERVVRDVLHDPSARLAFWLPRVRRYTDLQGRTVEMPEPGETEAWQGFARAGGETVVAIVHDPALDEDPELLEAAGAATLLALENNRLQEDLRRTVDDLRASRRRLVVVAAAERRRIERDLHDGAQQHLLAIRIQLELARETVPPETKLRAQLAALGRQLDEAIDEFRTIAHGIYPPLLADAGLRAALMQSVRRLQRPVDAELDEVGRLDEEVEAAVYFACMEAMQNAVKHAGDRAHIRVRLARDAQALRFSVADDGVGFSPRRRRTGDGLTNIADRIGAVGGTVSIKSALGEGTLVEGSVRVK